MKERNKDSLTWYSFLFPFSSIFRIRRCVGAYVIWQSCWRHQLEGNAWILIIFRESWASLKKNFFKLCVCVSVCISVYPSLSICLSICLSLCLSICLSIWLSVCLSICLSIYLSVCMSVSITDCLPIIEHLLIKIICLSIIYIYFYFFSFLWYGDHYFNLIFLKISNPKYRTFYFFFFQYFLPI